MKSPEEDKLKGMVRHLEDYMERNHNDIVELKEMFNQQRDASQERKSEIIFLLHKLEKRLISQDKDTEANRCAIDRHTKYFYLIWSLLVMMFLSLFGLVFELVINGAPGA